MLQDAYTRSTSHGNVDARVYWCDPYPIAAGEWTKIFHVRFDLTLRSGQVRAGPAVSRTGVPFCKLNLAGKCSKGEACKYSHESPEARSPSPKVCEPHADTKNSISEEVVYTISILEEC